jgi:gliding motility-associated-like protein
VEVKNKCGNYEESVFVKVDSCYQVYIPNIFSPNFDGTNDHFTVFDDDSSGKSLSTGDIANIKQLTIYDRWGEMVYQKNNFLPNDPTQGWDGTFRGRQSKQGDYVFVLSLMFKNNRELTKKGIVTLIR